MFYCRDHVGGRLVGMARYYRGVSAVGPIQVGLRIAGLFVVELACKPVKRLSVRVDILRVLFGPISASRSHDLDAAYRLAL